VTSLSQRVLAIVVASAAAIGVNKLIETLIVEVGPFPQGLDRHDPDEVRAVLQAGQMPMAALGLTMGGWWLAGFSGGILASRIGKSRGTAIALAVIADIFVLIQLVRFPHPTWMWIGGIIGTPLFVLGGAGESVAVPRA
jgi:hypothetical protein